MGSRTAGLNEVSRSLLPCSASPCIQDPASSEDWPPAGGRYPLLPVTPDRIQDPPFPRDQGPAVVEVMESTGLWKAVEERFRWEWQVAEKPVAGLNRTLQRRCTRRQLQSGGEQTVRPYELITRCS